MEHQRSFADAPGAIVTGFRLLIDVRQADAVDFPSLVHSRRKLADDFPSLVQLGSKLAEAFPSVIRNFTKVAADFPSAYHLPLKLTDVLSAVVHPAGANTEGKPSIVVVATLLLKDGVWRLTPN